MSQIDILVDLRSLFGLIRNQGSRPTCVAFAASDAHAAIRQGGWAPLSCEYAFYHAQRRASRLSTQGALLSAMLEALRHDGQPEESGWPYLIVTPADTASWVPPADVGRLFGRNGATASTMLDQIISELDSGHPVIILLMLSRAFYKPGKDAVIDPESNEIPEPARRHAVLAVGHGTVGRERAILVRNSWGVQWGEEGYGWLTQKFLGPRIFAAATLLEEVDVSSHTATA